MNDHDLETMLRATLSKQADHISVGSRATRLGERVIATATDLRPVVRRTQLSTAAWRTWLFPLLAAGTVAAIVGGFLLAGAARHRAAPPAAVITSHPSRSPTGASPVPTTAPPTPTALTSAPSPASAVPPAGPAGTAVPQGFHVVDLTFVSTEAGWALGTVSCHSSSGLCTALARTRDGGKSWVAVPAPKGTSVIESAGPCDGTCVGHVRFANPSVGYVFGPQILFMTTDAGRTWIEQAGGADALETLDDNVIKVSGNLLGSAPITVSTAAIGSAHWTRAALSIAPDDYIALTRTGHSAYLTVHDHLYASNDDGRTWVARADLCTQDNAFISYSTPVTAADGSLSLWCTASSYSVVETSINGGVSFTASPPTHGMSSVDLAAASAQVLFNESLTGDGSGEGLYRSGDGGKTWTVVARNPTGERYAEFLGFQSDTVGRWETAGGTVIWTTRDAGLTWTSYTFG